MRPQVLCKYLGGVPQPPEPDQPYGQLGTASGQPKIYLSSNEYFNGSRFVSVVFFSVPKLFSFKVELLIGTGKVYNCFGGGYLLPPKINR